ncbi:MAG: hypothetical protein Q9186_002854 [Xanthomendoza sp. 1 TL-2023]
MTSLLHPKYYMVASERVPEVNNRDFNASIKFLSHLHLQEVRGNRKAGASRQCYGVHRSREEVHMSQGPPASRPVSSQHQDDRYKSLPPLESRTLPPIKDNPRSRVSSAQEPALVYANTTPAQSPVNQKFSRSIGMQNILNQDTPEEPDRRRKADHFELPSPAITAASRAPSTSMTPSPGTVSLPSITSPSMHAYPSSISQGPRQILTPRSASAYAPSFTSKATIPGTIDAKASPFIGASEPVHCQPPPEPSHLQEHHPVPPLTSLQFTNPFPQPRSPPGRRPSGGSQVSTALDRRPSLAGSDSPSTTYSSYSQYSATPPIPASNPPSSSSTFFGVPYPNQGGPAPHHHHNHNHNQGVFSSQPTTGPVSSTSHHNHNNTTTPYAYAHAQIYTLSTSAGPIPVPVDTQAASKVADEKRKRNATASHRFRQRRKEKEMETNRNIEKLENQIGALAKEKEFYRQERDFFRGLVGGGGAGASESVGAGSGSRGGGNFASTPTTTKTTKTTTGSSRPISPRLVHASSSSGTHHPGKDAVGAGPRSSSTSQAQWTQQQMDRADEDNNNGAGAGSQSGRNTRRRTNSYVPSTLDMPPQQQQQQQQTYPQLQPQPTKQQISRNNNEESSRTPTSSQSTTRFIHPVNNPPMWHHPSSSSSRR